MMARTNFTPPMASKDPSDLSTSARRTAVAVSRLTFYAGLSLGIGLGGAAITMLTKTPPMFPDPAERWLVAGVFIGLSVMSFGFAAVGKARIDKFKKQ